MNSTETELLSAIRLNRQWIDVVFERHLEEDLSEVQIEDTADSTDHENRAFTRVEDFDKIISITFSKPVSMDPEGLSWIVSFDALVYGSFGFFSWPDELHLGEYSTANLPPREEWKWGVGGNHTFIVKGRVVFSWQFVKGTFTKLNKCRFISLRDIFIDEVTDD